MNTGMFDYFLKLVCSAFDTDESELLSKKRNEELSDARCILCHILSYQGISNSTIAQRLGLTSAGVGYLLGRYESRISQSTYFNNIVAWLRREAKKGSFPVRVKDM